jgi:ubiquinone/menaquinone biosynthesis C-methylase UbiE
VPFTHGDLVGLIREGVAGPGVWAELGSGEGAFTLALAELLGPDGAIYSVDRDASAIERQRRVIDQTYPDRSVIYQHADFTRPLDLPPLDGILMANSLHFVRRKKPVLESIREYLKPGGRLLLAEYNGDRGNPWVPHPLSYATWERLAAECGFVGTRRIGSVPSRFFGEIYSALSFWPERPNT